MSHTPFDRHFASLPLEGVESFPFGSHVRPQRPVYPQGPSHSTHSYVGPNIIPPGLVFRAHPQSQWAMSEIVQQLPEISAPIHSELTSEFARDIAPPFGTESMMNTPWSNIDRLNLDDFHRQYFSPPMGGVSQATTFTTSPTDGVTPLSSPYECHDE